MVAYQEDDTSNSKPSQSNFQQIMLESGINCYSRESVICQALLARLDINLFTAFEEGIYRHANSCEEESVGAEDIIEISLREDHKLGEKGRSIFPATSVFSEPDFFLFFRNLLFLPQC